MSLNNNIKKVCLFSDHHVSINPRLWKEAFFYEKHGFEVVIYSMWISEEFKERDMKLLNGHAIQYKCYLNLIDKDAKLHHRYFFRLRKKIAMGLIRYTGINSHWALTYSANRMYRALMDENADLYVAHMESAMIAAEKLIRKQKKVAFDFEDWYSNDYLMPGRPVKLLQRLEKLALQKGLFCTATSYAMADALRSQHGIDRPITVIYNGFPLKENNTIDIQEDDKPRSSVPKLIWFSRNIGPDRGIETLFESFEWLDVEVELHLLGQISSGYKQALEKRFPYGKGHQLVIHNFMDHTKLLPFISSFDIGLALEESDFPSRDVTITNKILQYLQASLKILATDSKGQREVAAYFPGLIQIVNKKNAREWSEGLTKLINSNVSKAEVFQKFESIFSWEAQEQKLAAIVSKL